MQQQQYTDQPRARTMLDTILREALAALDAESAAPSMLGPSQDTIRLVRDRLATALDLEVAAV